MFGLIGSFSAHPGKRDELVALMTSAVNDMPGCRSYVVGKDQSDPNLIRIIEIWDSAESHKASLNIPAVAAIIKTAMPLIAGFGDRIEFEPVGGIGI